MTSDSLAQKKQSTLATLFVVELAVGSLTLAGALAANSAVLYTNAARAGMDVFASLVAWLVVRAVGRRHANFDYGLGKLENIAVLFTISAMGVALAVIVWRGVDGVLNPRMLERTGFGMAMLAATSIANAGVFARMRWLHRRDASPVLEGQLHVYRNAVAAGVFALAAVAVATYAGREHAWVRLLDPVAALLLAAMVATSMWRLARRSLVGLLDGTVEEAFQQAINRELARHIDTYEALHGVRARYSGARVRVELFLEFPAVLPVGELLARSKALKSDIESAIPQSEVWVVPCDGPPSLV